MVVNFFHFTYSLIVVFLAVVTIRAEQHTVSFDNKCGYGTPKLIQGANTLSNGEDYVSNGPLSSAIAYLQTGNCGFNGENCVLVELTLGNPTCPGCGSSVDLSLIPPHAFNVETGFSYIDGCSGSGATCGSGTCDTAFFNPNDNQVQVACQTDNVGLLITFCGSEALSTPSPSSSDLQEPTQTTAPIIEAPNTQATTANPTTTSTTMITSSNVSTSPSATPTSNKPKCRVNPAKRRSLNDSQVNEARDESNNRYKRHHARAARFARRQTIA